MGQLDSSQQFVFEADPSSSSGYGQLRSKSGKGNLCVDALAASSPPQLSMCGTGKISDQLLWRFEESTQHLASKAVAKCKTHGMKGKKCQQCLDYDTKLAIWDCKNSSSGQQSNQYWHYNTKKESGVRPGAASSHTAAGATTQCLTVAAATGGGGAEAHIYGDVNSSVGVAFLSNYDEAQDYTVSFMDR
jgi:hypothetical protein